MADQPSIFTSVPNSDTNPNPNAEPNSNGSGSNQDNSFANLLGLIKNERGEQKYKDATEAFKGLMNAQEYIPQLKNELSAKDVELERLRQENLKLQGVEETVRQLMATQQQANTQQGVQQLDEKQIADLVNRTLTKQQTETVLKSNVDKVVATLQASFGAEAEKHFYTKGQELGMSIDDMNALAAKSPQAVLNLFGLNGKQTQAQLSVATGGFNTAGYQPKENSLVTRNTKAQMIGATTESLHEEFTNAKKMVDELHDAGMTTADLANPSNYFKHFGKK